MLLKSRMFRNALLNFLQEEFFQLIDNPDLKGVYTYRLEFSNMQHFSIVYIFMIK